MLDFSLNRSKETVITRADRALGAGQMELALSLYRQALDRNPRNPPIWIQCGHILKETGKLRQAEAAYRRALSDDPRSADAYLHLGHALKLQDRREEAEGAYVRAFALASSSPEAARELTSFGWTEDQLSQMRQAVEAPIAEKTSATAGQTWAFARKRPSVVTLADRARDAADWESAVRLYRKALDRNPSNPPILVQYGHALKESENLGAAETAYRRAIESAPAVADTHLQLGHVLKLQNRGDEARSAYLRAFILDPDLIAAGQELQDLGWPAEAVDDLRRALTSASRQDVATRHRLSTIALADQARDIGQWERAARLYRKALARKPHNPPIWVQLGHALKESGKLADAEAAYRQALACDPRHADAYLQLGHLLRLTGDSKAAQASYVRAFVLDPAVPHSLQELRRLGWSETRICELHQALADALSNPAREPAMTGDGAAATPMFSVIIPVYDRTWELREALDSLLAQSFRNFEIIIVTDATPPDTLAIVEEYIRKDQRIRAFHYMANSGNACRGRNRGIIEARGEFVSFLDSDDLYYPDTLERVYRIFSEQQVDFVCGNAYFIVDGTRRAGDFVTGSISGGGPINMDRFLRGENPIQTCTVHIRRDLLLKYGGFRIEQRYLEDLELWLRLAHYGCRFYYSPDLLAKYRFHQGNLELRFFDDMDYWLEHMKNNYRRPFEDWGIGPAVDRTIIEQAERHDAVPVWPARVDPEWYLGQYGDVARCALDPLEHFI